MEHVTRNIIKIKFEKAIEGQEHVSRGSDSFVNSYAYYRGEYYTYIILLNI